MKEGFYGSKYFPPKEKNLHQFKDMVLKEVIEYLEERENKNNLSNRERRSKGTQKSSIFDGFLYLLRNKGIRVSTPEWLQFLQVMNKRTKANQLKELVETNELLNKVRLFAKTTLIKNKADEAMFHEAFNEYFELAAKIYNRELQQKENNKKNEDKEDRDSGVEPDLKEQLGLQVVKKNLAEDSDHKDNEKVHGGKKDQHNDILKREDLSKQGGGDKKDGPSGEGDKGLPGEGKGEKGEAGQGQGDKGKDGAGKGDRGAPSGIGKGSSEKGTENQANNSLEILKSPKNVQQEKTEKGYLVGGGKGKSVFAERVYQNSIYEGERLNKQTIQEREKRVGKIDRRLRYEERPNKASMREVIKNIRRIILDVSEVKSKNVNLKGTVDNFARRDFSFDYEREREKQPEIVLLIDVGGPVDE
jgi:uncharacterized protein with von Willebrand factor type A (vWA) domain